MASSSSRLLLVNSYAYALLILLTSTKNAAGCYTSLFGFGDSLTDTGNLLKLYPPDDPPHEAFPPYGETFFHFPTGRCSDGRLIIDFMAEYYGLPLVTPYVEWENEKRANFRKGLNFAVIGSPALDISFYEERGIYNPSTNVSLKDQLAWFKEILPSLCHSSSSCSEILQSSLFLFGPFGGNDYCHSLFSSNATIDEVRSFVPLVAKAIGSAIKELIDLGVVTLVVPGMIPFGCLAAYLTQFETPNETEYDSMGCLVWLNKLAEHHNELLQRELNEIRELHPHATIIYADYYNAALPFYHSPQKYGFMRGAIVACCGTGGLYNFNNSVECGTRPFLGCDNPFLYVGWDGYHLTEAAYSLISKSLLDGPYTIPQINSPCVSLAVPSMGSLQKF